PFWFTNILTSLDSLQLLGFGIKEPQIQLGLSWLDKRQESDGTINLKILRTKDKDLKYWITLVISKIFKRYFE
ncbi:MAG: hypothetical protein WCE60_02910, partial [Methanobacterium sp.]